DQLALLVDDDPQFWHCLTSPSSISPRLWPGGILHRTGLLAPGVGCFGRATRHAVGRTDGPTVPPRGIFDVDCSTDDHLTGINTVFSVTPDLGDFVFG